MLRSVRQLALAISEGRVLRMPLMSTKHFRIQHRWACFGVLVVLFFVTHSWPYPLTVERTSSQRNAKPQFDGVKKVWWWISGEYQKVPQRKMDSLIGLSGSKMRKQLGNPSCVTVIPSSAGLLADEYPERWSLRSLLRDQQLEAYPADCDEVWKYENVVVHQTTGVSCDLFVYFQNGNCRHATASTSGR